VSDDDPYTNLKEVLPEFIPALAGFAFLGMGVAWIHYVGPLSGYFLALIAFGLTMLIIGTAIYAAYQMLRG
jgi:hypothetical protein